jgi:hypothetical protein
MACEAGRDTHGVLQDRPETWTVQWPAQFQKLTGTGAFDALATGQDTDRIHRYLTVQSQL